MWQQSDMCQSYGQTQSGNLFETQHTKQDNFHVYNLYEKKI